MSQRKDFQYRILHHFLKCPDPRKHRIQHKLIDIIVIVILAILCGEEGWEDICDWANDKILFLKDFLSLENDVPSPDTVRRVIERIDTDYFLEAFLSWSEELNKRAPGLINIDGKSLRKAKHQGNALHLVTAFAADSGITIGCKDAGGKGKEIPAIKDLLDMLTLRQGDIVTIDAIGCQKNIVQKVRKSKADYLIALKKNQENFWHEAYNFFSQAFEAEEYAELDSYKKLTTNHGRNDMHRVWITSELSWLKKAKEWQGLKTLVCVQRSWTRGKEKKSELRFYISSLEKSAAEFSELVRRHWAIENEYHWHLDVNFREDDSEISARSNKILRMARTIALQLLKAEPTKGMSIRRKKRRCHRSEDFLRKVLLVGNF